MRNNNHTPLQRAKLLRQAQTEAEARLWRHLRAHRLNGLKFKRQVPLGPYIVDFGCLELCLVIELDGGQHNEREEQRRDRAREQWLAGAGFRVLRLWNDEVLLQTDSFLEVIARAAGEIA